MHVANDHYSSCPSQLLTGARATPLATASLRTPYVLPTYSLRTPYVLPTCALRTPYVLTGVPQAVFIMSLPETTRASPKSATLMVRARVRVHPLTLTRTRTLAPNP